MAEKDTIDISSSDSDSTWDLAHYKDYSPSREVTSSVNPSSPLAVTSGTSLNEHEPLPQRDSATNPRILPSWASSTGMSLGNHGLPQKVPYTHKMPAPNGSSSSLIFSRISDRGSSFNMDQDNYSKYSSGNDHAWHSSQQTSKRTLPASLQPSVPSARSSSLVENVSSCEIREVYGTPSYMLKPYFNNGRNYTQNLSARVAPDDDVVMYESSGSRILPPSLLNGRSYSNNKYANSSDPFYHPMVGEEKAAGADERLIYQAALEDFNQPKIEVSFPDGLLSVSLLRHQKIALAWMLHKETRTLHCMGGILADDQGLGKTISMIALILMQRSSQLKYKSKDIFSSKTEALNLDDDDDNISVTLDKANKQTGESDDIKLIPQSSKSVPEFRRKRPAAGTLIVCPASVLRQWARELDDKVADDAKLSVVVYHGGNRTKDPVELAKSDVVLTTYSIVTNEVPKQPLVDEDDDDDEKDGESYGLSSEFSTNKKRKKVSGVGKKGKKSRKGIDSTTFYSDCGTLAKVAWFRVVLDEAQTIKNHRTQVARACCGLRAKQRWCLSGTPIQNAIDELFSYFRFLRYDPYANFKSFYNTIKIPISRNSAHGYMKLQAVLRAIMLRRTKDTMIDGQPIIKLPPKTIQLTKVDFSVEERAFYNKLEADSRVQFKAYAAAGTLNQNYASILLLLLRLRQACDHPFLVKGFSADSIKRVSSVMASKLPRDMLMKLSNLLEASMAICCICSDPPEDAVVTICGHVFCYQCVSEYLTGDDNTCPMSRCKEQLSSDVVLSRAMLRNCMSDDLGRNLSSSNDAAGNFINLQREYCSSKVRAVLEILQSLGKSKRTNPEQLDVVHWNGNSSKPEERDSDSQSEPPVKTILFSQWTSMLDIVEIALQHSNIEYRRLDGTMTLSARDKAVKEFNTDPEVIIMLMSLKAGNLGLNMVAACHVILLDLWWNPATEDQAIDRAHRIGQTRPVTVSRLTIKDTVEDRILALQEEKRKMVASAFGEDNTGGSAARLTAADLKYLFRA